MALVAGVLVDLESKSAAGQHVGDGAGRNPATREELTVEFEFLLVAGRELAGGQLLQGLRWRQQGKSSHFLLHEPDHRPEEETEPAPSLINPDGLLGLAHGLDDGRGVPDEPRDGVYRPHNVAGPVSEDVGSPASLYPPLVLELLDALAEGPLDLAHVLPRRPQAPDGVELVTDLPELLAVGAHGDPHVGAVEHSHRDGAVDHLVGERVAVGLVPHHDRGEDAI